MAYTKKDYDAMQAVRNDAQSKKDTIDPERRAQAEKFYNDFISQYEKDRGSIDYSYPEGKNINTVYQNGDVFSSPANITNMAQNDNGTVSVSYDNGYTENIAPQKSNQDIAREVRQGKRGTGQDRRDRLTEAGYDYNAVQQQVNRTAPKRPIITETQTTEPESREDTLTPDQKNFLEGVASRNGITMDVLANIVDKNGMSDLDTAIKDYKWNQKISRQDAINSWRDKYDIQYVQKMGWYITADWKAHKRDWSPITVFPG